MISRRNLLSSSGMLTVSTNILCTLAYIYHVLGTIAYFRAPIKPAELHYFTHKEESVLKQHNEAQIVLDSVAQFFNELRLLLYT